MFDHKILLFKVFNESIIIFGPPLEIQLGSHGWWDCVGGGGGGGGGASGGSYGLVGMVVRL